MTFVLATPLTRSLEVAYVAALHQTRGDHIWMPCQNRPVDEARNVLGAKFFGHPDKPEYIIYADSDATWLPDAALRLIERDLPVVTACIYRRGFPPLPTLGQFVGLNHKGVRTYEFASTVRAVLDYARKRGLDLKTKNELVLEKTTEAEDLLEIDGCGMHFICIKREVFRAIRMPWFRCPNPGAGEDFYFCSKVKEAGFPIYADLTVHTGHLLGPNRDIGIRELLSYFNLVRSIDDVLAGEGGLEVGR